MSKDEAVYIGDDVYATNSYGMIELRLGAHTEPVVVYLDQYTMENLIEYRNKYMLSEAVHGANSPSEKDE